jgi:uncharacterized membrane protein
MPLLSHEVGMLSCSMLPALPGVFFSSWLGSWMLALGEWIIKRLPLVKHIYSASKQVWGGGLFTVLAD